MKSVDLNLNYWYDCTKLLRELYTKKRITSIQNDCILEDLHEVPNSYEEQRGMKAVQELADQHPDVYITLRAKIKLLGVGDKYHAE